MWIEIIPSLTEPLLREVVQNTAYRSWIVLLNKAGEIGIRFSKEVQKKYLEEFNTTLFKSYNSIMHGYVLIPDHMLEDLDNLAVYLNESFDYVMSLEPK